MMSARLQAVANALADQNGWTSYTDARKAINASDDVMFSDEAIERAVDALAALESGPTVHIHPYRRMTLERQARAVVAALKGDG
jgi:hypothetical protein